MESQHQVNRVFDPILRAGLSCTQGYRVKLSLWGKAKDKPPYRRLQPGGVTQNWGTLSGIVQKVFGETLKSEV